MLIFLEKHITVKCQTAYMRLRMLFLFRRILFTSQKLLASQAFVLSLFEYIVYIPSFSQSSHLRIQCVQNSRLCFSHCVRKFDHISPLFDRFKWLKNLSTVMNTLSSLFSYSFRNSLLYLCDLISQNIDFSLYLAFCYFRHQQQLSFSRHRIEKFKSAFSYAAVK